MRQVAAFFYGLSLACAVLVLAGGVIGLGVIVAHCVIFGVQR